MLYWLQSVDWPTETHMCSVRVTSLSQLLALILHTKQDGALWTAGCINAWAKKTLLCEVTQQLIPCSFILTQGSSLTLCIACKSNCSCDFTLTAGIFGLTAASAMAWASLWSFLCIWTNGFTYAGCIILYSMPQRLKLSRPPMCARAGFYRHKSVRLLANVI